MIEQFRSDGYKIVGEPRITGDGYYEGAVLDPDGNIVEVSLDGKRTGLILPDADKYGRALSYADIIGKISPHDSALFCFRYSVKPDSRVWAERPDQFI